MNVSLRLKSFRDMFDKWGVDAFFVSSTPHVRYLSDFKNDESFLFITPTQKYFLTDSRYIEQARCEAKGYTHVLRDKKSYALMIEELCRKNNVKRLGVESSKMTYAEFAYFSRTLSQAVMVPVGAPLEGFRIVKDKDEIQRLKKAVAISASGMRSLVASLETGLSEREIQAKLEYDTKLAGSEKPAFDIIIACGPNSSMPHAVTGDRKLQKDDMLLVDMGVVYDGYHSDLTRCTFVGKIPRLHRRVYDIVKKAQELGLKKIGPGVKVSDVDLACRGYIEKMGYGPYFGHGTGHGVGLEIHEAPNVSWRSKEILKPGMVVTVEPGVYLPGKFGVRIEDMVLVTEKGAEVLTREVSKF